MYNSLYRDNNGLAYLLVPLYDGSEGFGEGCSRRRGSLELESTRTFSYQWYRQIFGLCLKKRSGKSFADFYYGKEIEQRFFAGVDQIRQALGGAG